MAESTDVNALKRRGRRRLVGAIALVLVAVIVLPWVFEPEPRSPVAPPSVRIPSEDDSTFAPKVTPRGEPLPKAPAKPAPASEAPKLAAVPAPAPSPAAVPATVPAPVPSPEKSQPKSAEKPVTEKPAAKTPPPQEQKRAENALADAGFVIALGAYADDKNIRALMSKLKAEKIPAYTEPLETAKGPRTRVRAGPFATEEEAEKARARLQRIGMQPGPIAPKAG